MRACGMHVVSHGRGGQVDVATDLADAVAAQRALSSVSPDVIVNLAALTNVDECEASPNVAYRANVRVVENLARWIKEVKPACYLLQVSTDQVYDGQASHVENDVTITNYYAFSKFAGELAARQVSSTVLRTNFVGRSRCPARVSLSDWLVDAARAKRPITVFDDIYFSPLSLSRLVEMILRVIELRKTGVYNLGSFGGMSKASFAYDLMNALGYSSDHMTAGPATSVGLGAYRPKDMRMDSSAFERAFGVGLPTLQEEIVAIAGEYADEAE
jgi:dTDP-4-dehydrorhamnose reductase